MGGPRHPVDDAARLVLGEGGRAPLAQAQEPFGAVAAHARQDTRDEMGRVSGIGGRLEHEVDGRPLVPDRGSRGDPDLMVAAGPLEQHVVVARRYECGARKEAVAVDGFAHLEDAQRVQPLGKGL
jgi:hypothetical protein